MRFAECLDEVREGKPTLLLFEGESGGGKSALLDEIETSPLLPRKLIRVARIDLADGQHTDPVRRAADLLTNTARFARVGGRRRVREIARKLLPDWLAVIPVWGDILEALTVTVRAVRKRVKKAGTSELAEDIEALHRHAQRRPTALLIDDLQVMGEAAADRMFRLMRHAQTGTRLLIVATVATPPPGLRKPAVRMLQDRLPPDRVRHHRLGSLTRSDIDEWMRVRFDGTALPPAVIDFLLAESGGQPGAVLHLLQRLLESGALRETDGSWHYDADLSDAQLDAMEPTRVHLGTLSKPVADIVSAASVFGDEFDALALARLLELDELELEDHLAVATRFGLLAVAGDQTYDDGEISTRYRFASSALRAALHRDLPATRRHELEARMPARPATTRRY